MIIGIVGLPGSGKTIYAVRELLRARAAGRKIFANFTSRNGLWARTNWHAILSASNATVMIDEAHVWFPAREWSRQTADVLAIFQQHRKSGLDLIWSAQNENRVDVALRELTAFIIQCRRVGPFILWSRFEGTKSSAILGRGAFLIRDYGLEYFTEERVLKRDEVSCDPIVGVLPNVALYEFGGSSRWVFRDSGVFGGTPVELFYRSPYGGPLYPWKEVPVSGPSWSTPDGETGVDTPW